jgi:hypothetical protein
VLLPVIRFDRCSHVLQTSSFEAERQSFYDNEQHLKSRIQSLTQSRKQYEPTTPLVPETEVEQHVDDHDSNSPESSPNSRRDHKQDLTDPETEPAEMTSLKLELSTLSTSYASLQSTLILLQTQLVDLKRVNHELQEENESYMILLRERTLSGLFDPMKQVGGGSISTDGDDDEEDEARCVPEDAGDVGGLRSTSKSTLDKVEEIPDESLEHELELSLQSQSPDSTQQSSRASRSSRHGRGRTVSHSPTNIPLGESLANLPITGPGLDLAAELGRAENKDILEGNAAESTDRSVLSSRGKKGKKHDRRNSAEGEASVTSNDIDVLRTEVKSLKDANKALSLYASKIIDRIISQEGFEHVLAADYDKHTPTPSPATAVPKPGASFQFPSPKKPRPQSIMGLHSTSNPEPEAMTSLPSPFSSVSQSTFSAPNSKAQRRSMSFDWKSFSLFGGTDKKEQSSNLRPLTLKPGASPLTGARKLETQEDENDRREREQLHATMKLMGIQPTISSPLPASGVPPLTLITKSMSSPASPPPQTASRFSFFSRSTTANSDVTSVNSTAPSISGSPHPDQLIDTPPSLTQAALEQAETENTLAALDAHERALSSEIASGSGSGFTEIPRRGGQGRRSRRSKTSGGGSGSGSTVWSAGIGEDGDE